MSSLFFTTTRGLPSFTRTNMINITSSVQLNRSFYVRSLIFETVFLLVFIVYFVYAILRVIKKIKNPLFLESKQPEKTEEEDSAIQQDAPSEKVRTDNLIYRFDEDEDEGKDEEKDEEKDEGKDKGKEVAKEKAKEGGNEDGDDEENEEGKQEGNEEREDGKEESESGEVDKEDQAFNEYHDEKEKEFLEWDNQLLFVSPFLLPFVVNNNAFAMDVLSLVCFFLAITFYVLFNVINIRGLSQRFRLLSLLFLVPVLVSFTSFYIGSRDMTIA